MLQKPLGYQKFIWRMDVLIINMFTYNNTTAIAIFISTSILVLKKASLLRNQEGCLCIKFKTRKYFSGLKIRARIMG